MVDAITTQVVRNRIASLMQEMHYHFYRSGYSTIIRESRDFSCVILDRRGGLDRCAADVLSRAGLSSSGRRKYSRCTATISATATCSSAIIPMTAACRTSPTWPSSRRSFAGSTLVGFAGSIAHKADVGGTNPGSTSANATEIFQEGLLLPPVKIYSRGVYNDDLERLILANSRQPELVRGDMHAQMAATQMGPTRILETSEKFGAAAVMECLRGVARRCRHRVARCDQGAARRRSLGRRLHGQ